MDRRWLADVGLRFREALRRPVGPFHLLPHSGVSEAAHALPDSGASQQATLRGWIAGNVAQCQGVSYSERRRQ